MILIIDNYDSFTWNLVQRFGELDPALVPGRSLLVERHDKITPAQALALDNGRGPSHLVISPGPCTPREAGVSSDMIRALAGRVPVLGVCLGHQCIADMHGIPVVQHRVLMHGKTSPIDHDAAGLYAGVPSPFTAARYHSLIVPAADLPPPPPPGQDGWTASAWTTEADGERVVMGLRRLWGVPTWPDGSAKQPLEGVQFHPESFLTTHGPRLLANFLAMGDRPRAVDPARLEALCRPLGSAISAVTPAF